VYIKVTSDEKFMRCSGCSGEERTKFILKDRERFRRPGGQGRTIDIEDS